MRLNGTLDEHLAKIELAILKRGLEDNGGNRVRTAIALGIRRTTLIEKLKRYGFPLAHIGRPHTPCAVYLFQSGDAVKIGWASNLQKRMEVLQPGSQKRIKLLAYSRVTRATARSWESRLHKLCKPWHLYGEWYSDPVAVLRTFRSEAPDPVLTATAHQILNPKTKVP